MITIKEVRQNLVKEYNETIAIFNNGDFQKYLNRVKDLVEWTAKLIIFDNTSEDAANKLLSGEWSIEMNNFTGEYKFSPIPKKNRPESQYIVVLAKLSIFRKHPNVVISTSEKIKQLKNKIETDYTILSDCYEISKKFANYPKQNLSDDEAETQARACALCFPKVFDDLSEFFSKDTTFLLQSLELPIELTKIKQIEALKGLDVNKDFIVLDKITGQFVQEMGTNYIAFLPEQPKDRFGNTLDPSILKDFFHLNWTLIIDLNQKTTDGLYEIAPSEKKSTIRIISDDTSEVTGGSIMTNWLFAKGRVDLVCYDDKKTLRETPNLFRKIFSKIVNTGSTNDYLIFDFCSHFPDLSENLFRKLEEVFGSWDAAKDRCKIISFSKDEKYKKRILKWSEISEIKVYFINASIGDFINHINEVKSTHETSSISKFLIHGTPIDLSECRERYSAVGIEFFAPHKTVNQDRKWDFYSGAEITWDELEKQLDVSRELYPKVKHRITDIIKNLRRTTIFTLKHRPGSGATTLAKRLAYDIQKDNNNGLLSCTVIEIKGCSNLRLSEQYLSQLSETLDNNPVLAIIESKRVGREKFDYLVKRISDSGKRVLFFYVEPYTGQYKPADKENVVFLESQLYPNEQLRFEEKYMQLGLSENMILEAKRSNKSLEVVDFPLMLRDEETSENLATYVQEWMDVLPDNLRKFCAYVGFAFKYSELGVNQMLLKSTWSDFNHWSSIMSYEGLVIDALKKLLIQESTEEGVLTGIWRPRYNRFSEFLLRSYRQNWQSSISDIAKDFLSMCSSAGILGSDDKDMLYSIFIIRKNADYRAVEDKANLRNKFSLLIKDINDIERAEVLFASLVTSFPDDPVFRGHFARFLYEKANVTRGITAEDRLFDEAQKNLNIAFGLDEDDSDLYHMQGMLYRRKIGALSKKYFTDLRENRIDENDTKESQDCLTDWTQQAAYAFEKSIKLSPASPYGYAAESQLYKEAIEFGRILLQCTDYSFCETNNIYSDYSEKLGTVLDLFEQICYAFKNEGLSQILNSYSIYENVRAFHQNLVGNNEESIQRYRECYGNATGEKKLLYANLLVKSIVYSKTNKKDTRRAFSNLSQKESREIEDVLEYQKNKGDVKSYETLFLLKLYGREEYSIDEAIDLLKEWENQMIQEDHSGWGYLNVCFYLAVCYCSKSIIGQVLNNELSSLATLYFKKSEDLAKKFDKSAILPQCYFGEQQDIHCIVDKNYKDQDATKITGVIHNIKNNKGILKMQCGIEVSFNAKGFDILHHEGQTLRGILGFSYSGPGLYDFRIDSDEQSQSYLMNEIDEKEISFEELYNSYVPTEDLIEENKPSTHINSNLQAPANALKIIGKIDVTNYSRFGKKTLKTTESNINKKNGQFKQKKRLHGRINAQRTKVFYPKTSSSFIIDKGMGFAPNCSPSEYDYIENELVIFDLKETVKPESNEPFFFAINIMPASEA